ncbi:hypothetical protein [Mycolicibacterium obuense]|uniref:Uncharacterized protein n=1 Tax=Mycolicibacterium obuense TaxID=1807 RepID=A0A0J6Y778_9MYCO|nr:hypothetical protein [Mycolicibacterium obuense]KMO68901.1 hypothetical protein MOBUDSM44075_04321 [Mycolicibacterium obuense]
MSHRPLQVVIPRFLTAVGDYDMVRVYRSPELSTESQQYLQVKLFLEANNLVLTESETVSDPDFWGGRYQAEWYTTPTARSILFAAGQTDDSEGEAAA